MRDRYLPEFLLNDPIIRAVFDCSMDEVGKVREDIEDLLNQCYVGTATWGLKYWERFVGLTVDETKPVVERREAIIAKLRGSGTATKALIESIAEAFAGDVEVIEDVANMQFTIKFVGTRGKPKNMADFQAQIYRVKPAHLGVRYEYTYITFGELSEQRWSAVSPLTWGELEVHKF